MNVVKRNLITNACLFSGAKMNLPGATPWNGEIFLMQGWLVGYMAMSMTAMAFSFLLAYGCAFQRVLVMALISRISARTLSFDTFGRSGVGRGKG